jgi:hypothetical protein
MSLAIRNAKFGAHQNVGNRKSISTLEPESTLTLVTKSSDTTDSSISGSVTVAIADQTSSVRSMQIMFAASSDKTYATDAALAAGSAF